jgi:hypothetical protein
MTLEKTENNVLLKGANRTWKALYGVKQGNFSTIDEQILEFVLLDGGGGAVELKALEVTTSQGIQFIPVLPVLWVL